MCPVRIIAENIQNLRNEFLNQYKPVCGFTKIEIIVSVIMYMTLFVRVIFNSPKSRNNESARAAILPKPIGMNKSLSGELDFAWTNAETLQKIAVA
jgi:hypothetical protein